ncbi:uncharacterized protein C12orf56-like [Montipora capricornis]|uniref:uncharacterized protein C12orf56-like n=1 Tax=Montipora capricornis TaxID=246305 RepID=UPI0035F1092C
MAVSSFEDGVQKHQKVYSFLKRNLSQERYEGVRVIEPCVIVADGFNRTFQFAVLGSEMLYITENPPKIAKDIKIKVDLACVTSVQLIHDVAEFLGGDLKTKNQHIRLEYKKPFQPASSHYQPVSVPFGESNATCKLAVQASILSTSPVLRHDALEQGHDKSLAVQHKRYMSRVVSQPLTQRSLSGQTSRRHLSASNPDLRSIDHFDARGIIDKVKSKNCRPLPPPPLGREGQTMQSNSSNRLQAKSVSHRQKKRPTSPHQQRKNTDKDDLDLDSSSSSTELELSYQQSSKSFQRQRSADFSRATSPFDGSRYRSDSNESTDSFGDPINSNNENHESFKVETTELHLYILRENSPMFLHLKSTWNNCILKSTLHFDRRSSSSNSPTSYSSKVDNSQLLHLFNQLKTEILQSHIMETTFVLVQELLTAAEKSFNLKKYFWKSPDLFVFMVGQLEKYMPSSPNRSSLKKGGNREDELDYVVVLLQAFICFFQETDILSTRLTVIKDHKGRSIKDLLRTLVIHPLTTGQSPGVPEISPAAKLLLSGANRNTFTVGSGDEEMNKLLIEVMDSATSLLFELICIVHQANCFSLEGNVLNIFWLMKILEAQEQTKPFVDRVMARLTSLVSSAEKYLCPSDAVLLYRQLFVLKNFLEYSTLVATHIQEGYAEEFRYYIRKPVVQKKLPSKFPLTRPTIELLEKVTSFVLNRRAIQQSICK